MTNVYFILVQFDYKYRTSYSVDDQNVIDTPLVHNAMTVFLFITECEICVIKIMVFIYSSFSVQSLILYGDVNAFLVA